MASVNDYGGPTDSLAAVPFGGVGGWAAAVAAALDNRDTTVDTRIAGTVVNSMTGTQTDKAPSVASAKSYADAKVTNTMTGTQTDVAPSVASVKAYVDNSLSASTAWAEYTPTVTQGVPVSVDWSPMRHVKIGRLVIVSGLFRCSSSGTAGQSVYISMPIVARTLPGTRNIGSFHINTGLIKGQIMLESGSGSTCVLRLEGAGNGNYTQQITNGWVMSVSAMYEAAS